MTNRFTERWRRITGQDRAADVAAELTAQIADLRERAAQLERDIEESRRLNERLSDVLDVVVELLVPAVDRNEEKLAATLEKLGP